MSDREHFIEALRASGRRLTRQRQLLLEVLATSQEHLDAETLYQRAKARDPKISLATVYRTLAVLKEMGLVAEHRLGEEHAHFEAVPETPHYHFTCVRCGQVTEFDAPQVQEIARELSEREQVQITDMHLFLGGYCNLCRQERHREGESNQDAS